MPNYIKNSLQIIGTNEQVKEVLDFLETDYGVIDFNSITPQPKWVYNGNLLCKKLEDKYGVENCWYGWRRKNWGNKWNARNSELVADNVIEFETAWSGVPELMSKLGLIFEDVEFLYQFADEDIGCNVGEYHIKGIDVESIDFEDFSKESMVLAISLWECQDDYKWNEETQQFDTVWED